MQCYSLFAGSWKLKYRNFWEIWNFADGFSMKFFVLVELDFVSKSRTMTNLGKNSKSSTLNICVILEFWDMIQHKHLSLMLQKWNAHALVKDLWRICLSEWLLVSMNICLISWHLVKRNKGRFCIFFFRFMM